MKFRVLLILILTLVCSSAYSQSTTGVNGCGSGWNVYLVPDSIPLATCDFKNACNSHDTCYSVCEGEAVTKNPLCEYRRCLKGGDLFGQKECNSPSFGRLKILAEERRGKCDKAFYKQIVDEHPEKQVCKNFAGLYEYAVVNLGKGSFVGFGASGGLTEADEKQTQKAINDLLTIWPEKRATEYVREVNSGSIRIDWTKSQKFDATRGLIPSK